MLARAGTTCPASNAASSTGGQAATLGGGLVGGAAVRFVGDGDEAAAGIDARGDPGSDGAGDEVGAPPQAATPMHSAAVTSAATRMCHVFGDADRDGHTSADVYIRRVDRLGPGDYRRILTFIGVALDADADDPFPVPVLEALRRLIPCDVVSYGHHAARGRRWGVRAAPEGIVPVPKSIGDAYVHLQDQDPFLPSPRTVGRAVRQSDLLTSRQLHALDFYAEIGRPLGIEYSMQLWLIGGGGLIGGFGLDASRSDFSERDRAILDFLSPDLVRLHRRAAARRPLNREAEAMGTLTAREREIVRLLAVGLTNAQIGRTLFISPGTVRKHLDNAYARLGVRSRAAAVAVAVRPA